MSLGLPTKLGSLSKESHAPKPESKKEERESKAEQKDTQGKAGGGGVPGGGGSGTLTSKQSVVQRCVILQKDEKGYGLTVSGDNPVHVQSIKENGAAQRADVRTGDLIIKVNGTLVTNCNHKEVVELIKSGSYVALTLMGRTPQKAEPLSPTAPPTAHIHQNSLDGSNFMMLSQGHPQGHLQGHAENQITGPQPVDAQKSEEYKSHRIATIRMMYDQAANEYHRTEIDYQQSPSGILQAKMNDQHATMKRLEEQLYQLTGIPTESQVGSPVSLKSPTSPQSYGNGDCLYGMSPGSAPAPPGTLKQPAHIPYPHPPGYGTQMSSPHDTGGTRTTKHQPKHLPWLPGGTATHKKSDSMPETLFQDFSVAPAKGKEATVSRSHSDSRRRELKVAECGVKVAEEGYKGIFARNLKKTMSLPSVSGSDSGLIVDHPPGSSPPQSPHMSSNASHGVGPPHGQGAPSQHRKSDAYSDPMSDNNDEIGSDLEFSPTFELNNFNPNVIMSMEDEFSEEEPCYEQSERWPTQKIKATCAQVENYDDSPFNDLSRLKMYPAHLAVFLRFLVDNDDPSTLLFYSCTENFATQKANLNEMRKWAYEIYSTFLVVDAPRGQRAPLYVQLDDATVHTIEQILTCRYDKEDLVRSVFSAARHSAQQHIGELLADFRKKQQLGLGSLYGEQHLPDDRMDRQSELRLVEKCLGDYFQTCMERDDDRNQAMASALGTVMKNMGVNFNSKNPSTSLDRCQSFVAKDKKTFKLRPNKKVHYVKSHNFQPQQFYTLTYCNHCQKMLWGVASFGYQCQNCEYNTHKLCVDRVLEQCQGKKTKKRGSKIMEKIRKPSTNNTAAIREAQKLYSTDVRDGCRLQHSNSLSPGHTYPPYSVVGSIVGSTSAPTTPIGTVRDQNHLDDINENDDSHLDHNHGKFSVNNIVQRFENRDVDSGELRSPTSPESNDISSEDLENHEKKGTSLNRSESLNKKADNKQKNIRRTRSDVQVDEQTLKTLNQSVGSSSTSSISTKSLGSLESPSSSVTEILPESQRLILENDSDIDVETELPSLDASIPKSDIKALKKTDKKRQEVINEFFHTERNHVRNIKVMRQLFFEPMLRAPWIPNEIVKLLFPNIDKMLSLHCELNRAMKKKRSENPVVGDIADILLDSFSGDAGITFQETCAECCRNQSHGLEVLKKQQRKDQKIANFLQEAHSNALCRRLELKDLLPTLMQRLTKYPLFIEKLIHYAQQNGNSAEERKLKDCLKCSKRILEYVNQAVRECENRQKLEFFNRRLDRRSLETSTNQELAKYRDLDLTQHTLLYEGNLSLIIPRSKAIVVQVILLDEMLVLLQKTSEDRYVLKCHHGIVQMGKDENKVTYNPIINLGDAYIRDMATEKRGLYLLTTTVNGPLMYQLSAHSVEERKRWLKNIKDAADTYKAKKEAAKPSTEVTTPSTTPGTTTTTNNKDAPQSSPGVKEIKSRDRASLDATSSGLDVVATDPTGVDGDHVPFMTSEQSSDAQEDSSMKQKSSPLESLKLKDEVITEALKDKEILIGELLDIPMEHVRNCAEIASELDGEKNVKELLLASLYQSARLSELVNHALDMAPPSSSSTSSDITIQSQPTSPHHPTAQDSTDSSQQEASNTLLSMTQRVTRSQSEPEQLSSTGLSLHEDTPLTTPSDTTTPTTLGQHMGSDDTLTPVPSGEQFSLPPSLPEGPLNPSLGVDSGKKGSHKEVHVTVSSKTLMDISCKLSNQLRELLSVVRTQEEERRRMELELKSHENQISALSRIQFPSSLTPSMTSSLTSSLTPSLTSLPGSSNVRTHSSYTCNTRVVQTHTSGGVNTRTVTQTTHNNTNNNGDISSFTDSLTDNLTDNQTSDLDNSRLTDSRPQSYISVTSENSGTEAEIEGYDGDIETPAVSATSNNLQSEPSHASERLPSTDDGKDHTMENSQIENSTAEISAMENSSTEEVYEENADLSSSDEGCAESENAIKDGKEEEESDSDEYSEVPEVTTDMPVQQAHPESDGPVHPSDGHTSSEEEYTA